MNPDQARISSFDIDVLECAIARIKERGCARLPTSFLSLFLAMVGEIDVAVEDPVLAVHLAL